MTNHSHCREIKLELSLVQHNHRAAAFVSKEETHIINGRKMASSLSPVMKVILIQFHGGGDSLETFPSLQSTIPYITMLVPRTKDNMDCLKDTRTIRTKTGGK